MASSEGSTAAGDSCTTRFGPPARTWAYKAGGVLGFPTLAGHLGVLVVVFGVACRASGLLHVGVDHGNDRVIRDPALARTIIVQNVTKPKLALLHQKLPKEPRWRG